MAVNMESVQKMVEQPIEKLETISPSVYLGGMFGSILTSLGLYFAGKRQLAIFVGLWAPTILNMGLFYKLVRPSNDMNQ